MGEGSGDTETGERITMGREVKRVALDFAAGGDFNCIAYRNGNKIELIKMWAEKDTMTAAGQIVNEAICN